jgi:hypothetical protein
MATRVWFHRAGAMGVPGLHDGYAAFSSAAAQAAADGLTWRHVFVAAENDALVGLSLTPEGPLGECAGPSAALDRSLDISSLWGRAGGAGIAPLSSLPSSAPSSSSSSSSAAPSSSGPAAARPAITGVALREFMAAAVLQLRSSLQTLGRDLDVERSRDSSSLSVSDVLVAYARRVGGTEIHSVMQRDAWSAEADAALRAAASAHGVSPYDAVCRLRGTGGVEGGWS